MLLVFDGLLSLLIIWSTWRCFMERWLPKFYFPFLLEIRGSDVIMTCWIPIWPQDDFLLDHYHRYFWREVRGWDILKILCRKVSVQIGLIASWSVSTMQWASKTRWYWCWKSMTSLNYVIFFQPAMGRERGKRGLCHLCSVYTCLCVSEILRLCGIMVMSGPPLHLSMLRIQLVDWNELLFLMITPKKVQSIAYRLGWLNILL